MKTLVMLLCLFPAIAVGQSGTITDSSKGWLPLPLQYTSRILVPTYIFDDDTVRVIIEGDTATTRGNHISVCAILAFLREWDKYKAECCVDSTEYDTGNCAIFWLNGKEVWRHDGKYWIHTPPTFDGFMEHIRRRLKP